MRNLEHQDFGFAPENRIDMNINPPLPTYSQEHLQALYRSIQDRLGQLPNVQSVSLALYSPLNHDNWGEMIAVEGKGEPSTDMRNNSSWDRISQNYFATMGQTIVRGRDFHPTIRVPVGWQSSTKPLRSGTSTAKIRWANISGWTPRNTRSSSK